MSAPTEAIRLGIGPANYAGQAFAWVSAVTRHLGLEAESFTVTRPRQGFQFDIHRRLSAPSYYLPIARRWRTARFLAPYSHVLLDGYRPVLYGDALTRTIGAARQVATLGLMAHGTDVRDPDKHMDRNPFSYFREGDDDWLNARRRVAAANRDLALSSGLPLFVSTPDMLHDLPSATWVPVCLDPEPWANPRPPLERRVPTVLFVPSQRTPPIKGTRYVAPVLESLHRRGLINYIAPSGVPHERMRELVRDSDVVVDQLLFGSYGVAAIEAMAAGRVVVGNLCNLDASVAPELPEIESATPEDFEERILAILDGRDEARSRAASNVEFVRRWHDGRVSAERIGRFLGRTSDGQ